MGVVEGLAVAGQGGQADKGEQNENSRHHFENGWFSTGFGLSYSQEGFRDTGAMERTKDWLFIDGPSSL